MKKKTRPPHRPAFSPAPAPAIQLVPPARPRSKFGAMVDEALAQLEDTVKLMGLEAKRRRAYFSALRAEGFTEEQAMTLTKELGR